LNFRNRGTNSVKARIKALWRGEVSLAQAFWTVTLLYGTLINLTATGLMFAALAAGLPSLIAVAMHLLPLPYNVLALMGVWHSANDYKGRPSHAAAAQIVTVLWFILMLLI
jgi:hypothetical protein